MTIEIKKFSPKDHFVRCTIYGASGSGKTVFSGTAPKAIFASSEEGLLSIVSTLGYAPDYVAIKSIEDMRSLYKFLQEEDHDYETLVIDSLSELNDMLKEGIEKKIKRPMQIQDWGKLSKAIKKILRSIKTLPMHTIVVCQEKVIFDKDGVVEQKQPMLNGKNATEIAYMMDIVGYVGFDKDGERYVSTKPHSKYITKDRTGKIGGRASLDFKDWIAAVKMLGDKVVQEVKKANPKGKESETEGIQQNKTKLQPKRKEATEGGTAK